MTAIPDDVTREIGYETCEQGSNTWPRYSDREAGVWLATPRQHEGEQIMYPLASDMTPLVRSEAEALYGPLTEDQELTT